MSENVENIPLSNTEKNKKTLIMSPVVLYFEYAMFMMNNYLLSRSLATKSYIWSSVIVDIVTRFHDNR